MDVPLTPLERARMLAPKERTRQELEAELVAALDAYDAEKDERVHPALELRIMALRMQLELGGFALATHVLVDGAEVDYAGLAR